MFPWFGGFLLGVLMFILGGLIPPPLQSCSTCVVFGPGVVHPACYVETFVQGRSCS